MSLDEKIEYSIRLLLKAEKIALSYDSQNGYYLAFSGGKDSQVIYELAKMAGVKFKAYMSITTVDPPEVIRFVKRNYPEVELVKPRCSIYQRAVERGLLPSMRIRWCCEDFKEGAGAGKVTIIGIRREESKRRARRNEVEVSSGKYSGGLEGLDEYRKAKLAKKARGTTMMNATQERTLGCISGKETLLISPIIQWTAKDVWTFLAARGIPHCELYDTGRQRIGCICCPYSAARQKAADIERYPHVKRNWVKAIKEMRKRGRLRKYEFLDGGNRLEGEEREDAVANNIFEWWISGKSYDKWFSEKFMQMKIDFDETSEEE